LRSGGGQNRHSWALLLLPYLEQGNVFQAYRTPITGVSQTDGVNNQTSTDPTVVAARQTWVKPFVCPSRRSSGRLSPLNAAGDVLGMPSDYAACVGNSGTAPTNGVMQLVNSNHMLSGTKIMDMVDGASNTLILGEKHIQIDRIGDYQQDGIIYSAGETLTYSRRAGNSNILAISPETAINNQFGSLCLGMGASERCPTRFLVLCWPCSHNGTTVSRSRISSNKTGDISSTYGG
jgi:hypothetical protein